MIDDSQYRDLEDTEKSREKGMLKHPLRSHRTLPAMGMQCVDFLEKNCTCSRQTALVMFAQLAGISYTG